MSGARAAKPLSTDPATILGQSTSHEPSMDEILASIRQIISDQNDEADMAASKAADEVANPQPSVPKVDSIIGSVAAKHFETEAAPTVTIDAQEPRGTVNFDDLVEPETREFPSPEEKLEVSLDEALSKAVLDENPYQDLQADIHAAVNAAPAELPETSQTTAPPAQIPSSDSALDRLIAKRSGTQPVVSEKVEPAPRKTEFTQDMEKLRQRNEEIRQAAARFKQESATPPAPVVSAPVSKPAQTPILSTDAKQSVNASFERLALSMLEERKEEMDMMMVDIMRPMLKSWLEDNLPSLVERLVREEIERVSRGVH